MKLDLALTLNANNIFDIDFSEGDFLLTEGFDTALLMSLFCEKRAAASEVPSPEYQRGWWGNLFNDNPLTEMGSKLWLLEQARRTQDTLNRAITYAEEALKWLIDDNFAQQIIVNASFTVKGIRLDIKLLRSQNVVGNFSYELWQGTGLLNAN